MDWLKTTSKYANNYHKGSEFSGPFFTFLDFLHSLITLFQKGLTKNTYHEIIKCMKLKSHDALNCILLFAMLDDFVDHKLRNKTKHAKNEISDFSVEKRWKLRKKLYNNHIYIDAFIEENPFNLNKKELAFIKNLKFCIQDTFIICKFKKKFLFKSMTTENYYHVLGLTDNFKDIFPYFPTIIETHLVPYKNQIIWDGLALPQDIFFGKNITTSFMEEIQEVEKENGIILSLTSNTKTIDKQPG